MKFDVTLESVKSWKFIVDNAKMGIEYDDKIKYLHFSTSSLAKSKKIHKALYHFRLKKDLPKQIRENICKRFCMRFSGSSALINFSNNVTTISFFAFNK